MNDLLNFAFDENLVRVIQQDGEPWFVHADVCKALCIANPSDAISRLEEDERQTNTLGNAEGIRGNPNVTIISLPGLLRLVSTSRTPVAKRFQRWVFHDVLPAIFKTGRYELPAIAKPANDHPAFEDDLARWKRIGGDDWRGALHCVREARVIYGKDAAKLVWMLVGLPQVPKPPAESGKEGAVACLAHLLSHEVAPGENIRSLIEVALDGGEMEAAQLLKLGVRVRMDQTGILIANPVYDRTANIFDGTPWMLRYPEVLRQLPGTFRSAMRFPWRQSTRCTFVPMRYLDQADVIAA